MLDAETAFEAFVEKLREKLKIAREKEVKIKVRDEEGDLITMGDTDDWDMTREGIRKEVESEGIRGEEGTGMGMGKMEVWVMG